MPTPERRAVFLDRDGVLNRSLVVEGKPFAPRRLRDFRLLPGAAAAVRRLKTAGFVVVVVTNQPDIGNGLVEAATVAEMNRRLMARAPVDEVRVCPHTRRDGCACRKPRPGMLVDAAARFAVDLTRSTMVGDRAGDIEAGRAAGCFTIKIERGYAEPPGPQPDMTVRSLAEAVEAILARG